MEHRPHGKHPRITLLVTDPVLFELVTTELTAARADFVPVTSPDELPSDGITVVDLDAFQSLPKELPSVRLIGITRREKELPDALRARLYTVLHRPFPLDALHSAVLEASSAPDAQPSRTDGERPRRMAVRRLPRKTPTLSVVQSANAIRANGAEIALTPSEMTVFLALLRAGGAAVTREELARLLCCGESNLPDVHVCAIRKKLAPYGMDALVHTVRGVGYRLLRPDTRV